MPIEAVMGRPKGKDTVEVQAYTFSPKNEWTVEEARAWLEKHRKASGTVDETEDAYRFCHRPAGEFEEGSFRTITIEASRDHDRLGRRLAVLLSGPGTAQQCDGKTLYEIPIAVTGSWVKGSQEFSITKEALHQMVANFAKRKNEQVVIDYEHASEMPEIAQGGPVPAAGWIHGLKANGVLRALVEWTPQAAEMIRTGQYRFFSPAIDWAAKDKQTGEGQGATLTSGALTNHPFLEELPPIMLTDGAAIARAEHDLWQQVFLGDEKDGGPAMPDAARTKGGKVKKVKLIKKLTGRRTLCDDEGLELGEFELRDLELDNDETAALIEQRGKNLSELLAGRPGARGLTEIQIRERLELAAAAEKMKAAEGRRALLFSELVKDGKLDEAKLGILAREEKLSVGEYHAFQSTESLIAAALAKGKMVPAERELFFEIAYRNRDKFAKFIANRPQVVSLKATGIAGDGGATKSPAERLAELTRAKAEELKIPFKEAGKIVLKENPELRDFYRQAPN